jgi:hypothetical protein
VHAGLRLKYAIQQPKRSAYLLAHKISLQYDAAPDGFGGLVVSMLASGSRVRGFDPDRSRWIFFRCEKILSMPSFGGEVK